MFVWNLNGNKVLMCTNVLSDCHFPTNAKSHAPQKNVVLYVRVHKNVCVCAVD